MAKLSKRAPTAVGNKELRFIRRRFGLSLNEAAKILKTTRHYLTMVEEGDRPCHVKYALMYERAMGKEWFQAMRLEYEAEQAAWKERYAGSAEQNTTEGEEI